MVTRLRELRGLHALTQDDLARKSGVGKATITRIETGTVAPGPGTLRKLAEALGVEPADLIKDAEAYAEARRRAPRKPKQGVEEA